MTPLLSRPQSNGHRSLAKSQAGDCVRGIMTSSFNRNQIAAFTSGAILACLCGMPAAHADESNDRSHLTRTPIKHVILIIGENRTFDHVFATYTPPRGQTVSN